MNYRAFCRLAVDSAQRYFQYLVKEDKGIIITEVSRIDKLGEEVFLHLRGRISPSGLESLKLRIYADEFKSQDIRPVEYHSEHGILVLHPQKALYDRLPSGPCEHISIISDLRFLVERVRDWYRNDRPPIVLPQESPNVNLPSLSDMAGGTPTEEQYSTVCNVLTYPFTYVWGAPGTGKTRFVLANCVLAYLREGKQVLLTAPTNNALEQMLAGVLDILRSCDIPDSRAYRLGIPSAAFAEKYPDACEQRSVETRRDMLIKKLKILSEQYDAAVLYQRLQSDLPKTAALIDQLNEISAEYKEATVPKQELDAAHEAVNQAQKALNDLDDSIQELTIWLDSFPGKLSRIFRPSVYSKKSTLLKSSTRNLESTTQAHILASQQLTILEDKAQTASQNYYKRLEELRAKFLEAFPSSPLPQFSIPPHIATPSFPAYLRMAYGSLKATFEKLPPPANTDIAEIGSKLDAVKKQLERLNAGSEKRWANVQVWAMTIDRFIALSETPPNFSPAHVFMDEAAYCSLIKGYTLLSICRPITLLGDHAQLPPVCEISERILNREFCPEFLWAQSAIHLGSIFRKSEFDLYEDYRNAAPPSFLDLQLNTLSITHRFGPRLSLILSDFIYSHGLTSAKSEETSIKFIQAPASSSDIKRTSSAECSAIRILEKELSAKGVDFAILAPYKKQVALLAKTMPNLAAAGRIMTVHAAQGREFDTVILSVVDTTDKFFVASDNPVGRAVLNTAISRVKANLILVLDAEYWRTQKQELIGRLI